MRRALSVFLTVLAAIALVAALTDFHVDSCTWTVGPPGPRADGKEAKEAKEAKDRGPIPQGLTAMAFHVHGGDNAYGKVLREGFAEEVARRQPQITTIVDGPQPKGALLVKSSLVSGDVSWTPVWGSAKLGVHALFVGPQKQQVVAEATLIGTCKGLVSRSHFQSQFAPQVVAWLGTALDDALKPR
jgi:hypothetical protein